MLQVQNGHTKSSSQQEQFQHLADQPGKELFLCHFLACLTTRRCTSACEYLKWDRNDASPLEQQETANGSISFQFLIECGRSLRASLNKRVSG